jgi:hypothetical protein
MGLAVGNLASARNCAALPVGLLAFVVAFAHVRDLLVRAKHLFIAARVGISRNLLDNQLKFR